MIKFHASFNGKKLHQISNNNNNNSSNNIKNINNNEKEQ